MPDLNKLRNTRELENLYVGKVIVVVEAESDAKLFDRLVGPGYGEYIEFQVPAEKGTGCGPVKMSVQSQRERNKRIFGLIDGEASVPYQGGYDKFVECGDALFQLDALDGIMFLAEHEAENILINYADLAAYIAADESLMALGRRDARDVDLRIEAIVERHFWAAMCKYVSYGLREAKLMDGVLGNPFFVDATLCRSMRSMKVSVEDKGGNWVTFLPELKSLRHRTESYLHGLDETARKKARRRLTDGKIVLGKLQSDFGLKPTWQGHLLKEVEASSYASTFREELFRRTDIHV